MTDKPIAAHELRALWQRMPTTPVVISADDMRARAQSFQAHIRRRNLIEYGAATVVVSVLAWYATWSVPAWPLWPIANVLLIVGLLICVFNLHRRGRAGG
jgi:hypothetical protein